MAVLKMGSTGEDRTWLTDVDKVIQRFFVSRHMETCSVWDLLRQALEKEGRKDLLEDVYCPGYSGKLCSAVPDSYKDQVSLLKVFRRVADAPYHYNVEYWIAPVESTWLMSDDGRTIDRL